jgi:hypothetical protein
MAEVRECECACVKRVGRQSRKRRRREAVSRDHPRSVVETGIRLAVEPKRQARRAQGYSLRDSFGPGRLKHLLTVQTQKTKAPSAFHYWLGAPGVPPPDPQASTPEGAALTLVVLWHRFLRIRIIADRTLGAGSGCLIEGLDFEG